MPIQESAIRKEGMTAKGLSTYNEYGYFYSEEAVLFGAGVMRGTDGADQCKNMVTGGKFLGVAAYRNVNVKDSRQYAANDTVEVITKGHIWVKVAGSAVVAGDIAASGVSGKFAKKDTATYAEINGVFETAAAKDGYAILHLKG